MNNGQTILERALDQPRIEAAMKKAMRDMLIRHKAFGHPIVVWRDGQIKHIPAEEIVIPDPVEIPPS